MNDADRGPEPGETSRITLIPGVDVTVFSTGTSEQGPVLLWVGDDSEQANREILCALQPDAVVLAVRPRFAEDSASAVDDLDRALQWARCEGGRLGGDITQLTIIGVGPGAQQAVALGERVARRGVPEIALIIVTDAALLPPPRPGGTLTRACQLRDIPATLRSALPQANRATHLRPAIHVHELVEPPTRAFLDRLARWDPTSIDTIRASYGALPRVVTPPHPEIERRDDVIQVDGAPSVPVRWYRPKDARSPLPTIMYIHGGAFIMGSLDENDDRLDSLARELGCAIVSVDYRLAPEHPYPAALDDVASVWQSLIDGSNPGVDPARLALLGSSAGAGLAAALCIRLRDLQLRQPRLQCLAYPMLDDREHPSIAALSGGSGHWGLWPASAEKQSWDAYLADTVDRTSPPFTAVPGRASREHLRGLAPAFIGVGDVDALVDSNILYASTLISAGVPTEFHIYPGVIHGGFTPHPVTPGTRAFLRDVTAALRSALA